MNMRIQFGMLLILIVGSLAAGPATEPVPDLDKQFPNGGGIGPRMEPRPPRKIVYVIDVSGMSQKTLDVVMRENKLSIVGLKPIQAFDVIFVQKERMVAISESGLFPASPENKKRFDTFAKKITTCDRGDIIPALRRAFGDQPELVFLLAHTSFTDNDAVQKKVAELNKEHKVKVDTIAMDPDENDPALFELLKTIARENNGHASIVKSENIPHNADPATQPVKP